MKNDYSVDPTLTTDVLKRSKAHQPFHEKKDKGYYIFDKLTENMEIKNRGLWL